MYYFRQACFGIILRSSPPLLLEGFYDHISEREQMMNPVQGVRFGHLRGV